MRPPRVLRSGSAPRTALLIAGLIAAALAFGAQAGHLLTGAEQATVNARFALRPAHRPAGVAVVGIGDQSFEALNRSWPFPRRLHAQVIRRLRAAGARGIVYDVQFTEPTDAADDTALYRALGPDVVLATSETDSNGHANVLGGDASLAKVGARAGNAILQGRGSELTRFKHSVGGLASLAVLAAERLGGARPVRMPAGGALIDFRGPPGTIPSLQFSDVVFGHFPASAVRGRIVVVGATASTLQDVHAVPTSSSRLMSGPEVEANAIWTALHGDPLHDASALLALVLIVLLAMLVPVAAMALRSVVVVVLPLVAAGVYLLVAQLLFAHGTVVPVVGPLLGLAIGTVSALVAVHGAELRTRLVTARRNDELEERVRERTEELRLTQLEIVDRLGQAAEWRDSATGAHIERMSLLCEHLALAIGMDPDAAEMLRHAAAMHDVGKIGLPDDLLLKPAQYSSDERRRMQAHAMIGAEILAGSRSPLLQLAEQVARTHHERWDGGGYPAGLRGEEIPLAGRICAVCDVFDALISERPYKSAWPIERALAEIERSAGTQFDPELVAVFLTLRDELSAGLPAPARGVLRVA